MSRLGRHSAPNLPGCDKSATEMSGRQEQRANLRQGAVARGHAGQRAEAPAPFGRPHGDSRPASSHERLIEKNQKFVYRLWMTRKSDERRAAKGGASASRILRGARPARKGAPLLSSPRKRGSSTLARARAPDRQLRRSPPWMPAFASMTTLAADQRLRRAIMDENGGGAGRFVGAFATGDRVRLT